MLLDFLRANSEMRVRQKATYIFTGLKMTSRDILIKIVFLQEGEMEEKASGGDLSPNLSKSLIQSLHV